MGLQRFEEKFLRLARSPLTNQSTQGPFQSFVPGLPAQGLRFFTQLLSDFTGDLHEPRVIVRKVFLELLADGTRHGWARSAARDRDCKLAAPDDRGQNKITMSRVIGDIDPDV